MLGRIVTLVLGVGITSLLAQLLTHQGFGAYLTSYSLMVVGTILAQLGLDRVVVRLVSAALGVGLPGGARQVIRIVLGVGTVAAVVFGAIFGLVLTPWLGHHVYHSNLVANAAGFVGLWVVAATIQSLLVETFRGLQRFDLTTIYDQVLVDMLMVMIFAALFVFRAHIGLGMAVAITIAVTALITLLAGLSLRMEVQHMHGRGGVSRAEIFGIAWPSLVSNASTYLIGSGVDVLVLGAFKSQANVALYGSATRLVTLVATPLLIVGGVLPPLIAELYARGKARELERTLRAGATLAGLPALVVLLVFLLFGKQVLHIVYRQPYFEQAATILAILSGARLISVWAGSAGVTLLMTGHQRAMMYTTLSTGLYSLGADIVAVQHFGAPGVAVATGSAIILQNLLQLVLAKHLVGVWAFIELSPRKLRRFFFSSSGAR